MRIAFLVPNFPGLSETFILNQITGLLDLGHDVRIFATLVSQSPQIHNAVNEYDLLSRTRYRAGIPRNKMLCRLKTFFLVLINFCRAPRIVFRALRLLLTWEYGFLYEYLYFLFQFLNERVDIIQCHYGACGNIGAFLKRVGVDAKVVTMFHGVDIRRGVMQGGAIYRNLFEFGDRLLAISEYNYSNLIDFGADRDRVIRHPVGIDLSCFPVRKYEGSGTRRTVTVLSVARLVEEKGLEFGIKAVHMLRQRQPSLSLRYNIVGGGALEGRLRDLIGELGLEDVVFLLGPQTQSEVIRNLMEADLYLMPSIAEALPVVLMEAHAAGLPCIATRVGSTDEIVLDGKSGFLVPPQEAGALTDKLEYLVENRQQWPAMGQVGRRHVKDNYDISVLNRKLERIFEELLDGH